MLAVSGKSRPSARQHGSLKLLVSQSIEARADVVRESIYLVRFRKPGLLSVQQLVGLFYRTTVASVHDQQPVQLYRAWTIGLAFDPASNQHPLRIEGPGAVVPLSFRPEEMRVLANVSLRHVFDACLVLFARFPAYTVLRNNSGHFVDDVFATLSSLFALDAAVVAASPALSSAAADLYKQLAATFSLDSHQRSRASLSLLPGELEHLRTMSGLAAFAHPAFDDRSVELQLPAADSQLSLGNIQLVFCGPSFQTSPDLPSPLAADSSFDVYQLTPADICHVAVVLLHRNTASAPPCSTNAAASKLDQLVRDVTAALVALFGPSSAHDRVSLFWRESSKPADSSPLPATTASAVASPLSTFGEAPPPPVDTPSAVDLANQLRREYKLRGKALSDAEIDSHLLRLSCDPAEKLRLVKSTLARRNSASPPCSDSRSPPSSPRLHDFNPAHCRPASPPACSLSLPSSAAPVLSAFSPSSLPSTNLSSTSILSTSVLPSPPSSSVLSPSPRSRPPSSSVLSPSPRSRPPSPSPPSPSPSPTLLSWSPSSPSAFSMPLDSPRLSPGSIDSVSSPERDEAPPAKGLGQPIGFLVLLEDPPPFLMRPDYAPTTILNEALQRRRVEPSPTPATKSFDEFLSDLGVSDEQACLFNSDLDTDSRRFTEIHMQTIFDAD